MRDGETRARGLARRFRKEMTRSEVLLWAALRREATGWRFRRQHPIGPYVADFACIAAKLVVEVDGATHFTPEERAHDARRAGHMTAAGWSLLRVTSTDVYEDLDAVVRTIMAALGARPPAS